MRAIETSPTKCASSILVVEDNLVNRMVIQGLLEKYVGKIAFAENGVAAIEQFKSENYRLILMDINMPIMDGITATREIRKLEREAGMGRTPIVAVTAHDDDEHRNSCTDAEMDGFVPKPVKAKEFFNSVSCWLA